LFHLRSSAFICGFILLLLAGCCPTAKEPYYGPTLGVHEAVARINANNELIPTLWSTTDLEISVIDDKGHHHSYSGNGSLLYRKQGDLFLNGTHVLGTPLFEMGSNNDDYWLTIPEMKQAWWGHHRNVGKPCVQPLPIRPELLVEVLGISTFNSQLLEPPVPVMKINHEEPAYVFTWHVRLPDRWIAVKEIWYSLDLVPTRVLLLDNNGRTILKATLKDPKPIEIAELPKEKWPKMPTRYELQFPESKAGLTLKLDSIALTHRTKKSVLPNDGTFATPEEWDPGLQVIQVDKGCGD
jgi:hypothetical protein